MNDDIRKPDLYVCPNCEEIVNDEPVKAYECPECGDRFTESMTDSGSGNRSPCCGKFGSLASECAHDECGHDLDQYAKL